MSWKKRDACHCASTGFCECDTFVSCSNCNCLSSGCGLERQPQEDFCWNSEHKCFQPSPTNPALLDIDTTGQIWHLSTSSSPSPKIITFASMTRKWLGTNHASLPQPHPGPGPSCIEDYVKISQSQKRLRQKRSIWIHYAMHLQLILCNCNVETESFARMWRMFLSICAKLSLCTWLRPKAFKCLRPNILHVCCWNHRLALQTDRTEVTCTDKSFSFDRRGFWRKRRRVNHHHQPLPKIWGGASGYKL